MLEPCEVGGEGVGRWVCDGAVSHQQCEQSPDLEGLFCMNLNAGPAETVSPIVRGNLSPEDVHVLGILRVKRKHLEIRR